MMEVCNKNVAIHNSDFNSHFVTKLPRFGVYFVIISPFKNPGSKLIKYVSYFDEQCNVNIFQKHRHLTDLEMKFEFGNISLVHIKDKEYPPRTIVYNVKILNITSFSDSKADIISEFYINKPLYSVKFEYDKSELDGTGGLLTKARYYRGEEHKFSIEFVYIDRVLSARIFIRELDSEQVVQTFNYDDGERIISAVQ